MNNLEVGNAKCIQDLLDIMMREKDFELLDKGSDTKNIAVALVNIKNEQPNLLFAVSRNLEKKYY